MSELPSSPLPVGPGGYTPKALAGWWRELIVATKYLTRLRIPLRGLPDKALISCSMGWFPLIGALIGAFGATVDGVAGLIGLPANITAAMAVAGMMWLTRALREEELASLANQYGEAGDKSRRVGWLREERSIRYGTFAVILGVLLKMNAISSLNSSELVYAALITGGAWSHAVMALAAAWLNPLPGDPVSEHFGQPPGSRVLMAILLGLLLVVAVLGQDAPLALGAGTVAAVLVIMLGGKLMGGYNGPLLGGLQQVVELTVICSFVAAQ